LASIMLNTRFSSPGELEMTFSTSEVAVCCSSASLRSIGALAQLVEQACILDSDDGLGGKVLHQLDLLVGEGADLLAINNNCANQVVGVEHWDRDQRSCAAKPGGCTGIRFRGIIGGVVRLLRLQQSIKGRSRRRVQKNAPFVKIKMLRGGHNLDKT